MEPVLTSDRFLADITRDGHSTWVRVFVVVLHSVTIVAVGIGLLIKSWLNAWCLVANWEASWVLSVIVSSLNNLGSVMLVVTFTMVATTSDDRATDKEEDGSKDDASNDCTSSSSYHSGGTTMVAIIIVATTNRDIRTSIARITWLIIASR